jgi:hypothetical protein
MSIYQTDFVRWSETQRDHLIEGRFDLLDLEHLIEEVGDLGKRYHDALKSQLKRLLIHLLKLAYSKGPREPEAQWRLSIGNARDEMQELLEDNPSLRQVVPDYLPVAYQRASGQARRELEAHGDQYERFPDACPWTLEQIQDVCFFPGE